MVKKAGSTSISFRTNGGKEIAFKAKGANVKRRQAHVKQMEKRLSAIEKAVMQYNKDVQDRQTTKATGSESGENKDGKSGRKKPVQTVVQPHAVAVAVQKGVEKGKKKEVKGK